jgi:hypothetical protein
MYFCTYFDAHYLVKGLVCNHTIHQYQPNSTLFILCLDEVVYNKVKELSGVIPIKLEEIEEKYPELLSVKHSRCLKEYYATISPILPLYIFHNYKEVDVLFYTDADIAFWSDPEEMLEIFGDFSLMVTDHGFEPPRANVRFNVGILAYRNDKYCNQFLEWWKEKCLEWCKWETLPNGMCADQGYLNILHDEPEKFKNVLSCPHFGINLGPWNIGKHKIYTKNNKIKIDNDRCNLICYHYHEFMLLENGYFSTGWPHTKDDKITIYDPYFNLIQKVMNNVL